MAENWFQLGIKWLFFIIGVPTLTYILLFASIQHTFETATTGYQIFIGFVLIICLLFYVYFAIIKLVEETKEFFS
jgi:bacteriorhodopsin